MHAFFLGLAMLAGSNTGLAGETFWAALEPLCGKAFAGELTRGTEPSDAAIGEQRLVMHVRECSEREIRIPFHVGDDHSRTWVLTRDDAGVRLKHDHRHEDGSEDEITQYGGDSRGHDGRSLEFPADAYTAEMLPAAASNVWTMAVTEDGRFIYQLRREEQGRYFTVEFDLAEPVETPPVPWGYED
ncbi:MAG: hypothetical protein R3270_04175 [Gammaproteobacteria bacterium]|nr:hypothetical protein [Gammaproteobacteria bacterium]